ncbi:uncharacterized protein [Narcine bancroftii]|uniref:uncharacterized protein n=1 Tax=Narcine bancroftii TaxID=1343680 RepID=UPI003831F234
MSSKPVAQRERYDKDTLNVSNQCTCQRERVKTFANVQRQASTHNFNYTHTVTHISNRNAQSSPDWAFLKHPLGSSGIQNPYHCIVKGSSSYKQQKRLQIANAPCHLKHQIRLHAALGIIIQQNTMALRLRAEDKQRLPATLQQHRLPLDYSFAAEGSACERPLKDTTHNGQAVKNTSSGLQKTSHAQTCAHHQPLRQNTFTQRMYGSQHLSEDTETAIRLLTSWENHHVPLYLISNTDLKENGGLKLTRLHLARRPGRAAQCPCVNRDQALLSLPLSLGDGGAAVHRARRLFAPSRGAARKGRPGSSGEAVSPSPLTPSFSPSGESQGLTIHTDRSRFNVPAGGDATFSVRPSVKVRSGNWGFMDKTIVTWVGSSVDVDNAVTSRAELFLPNGSLLLKSVTRSDSGDYTVNMIPDVGDQQTATIALLVIERLSPGGLSAGAKAGVAIGVIAGAAMVCGLVVWFVRSNMNRRAPPGRRAAEITAGRNNALTTDAESTSQTYENIPRMNKPKPPPDDSSTYMGLNLEDRSVYSDLKR